MLTAPNQKVASIRCPAQPIFRVSGDAKGDEIERERGDTAFHGGRLELSVTNTQNHTPCPSRDSICET